jgi:hypothetical protein
VPIGFNHQDRRVEGPVTFSQRHPQGSVEIGAIFDLSCLNNRASFLSVRILTINGEAINLPLPPGFMASFTRTSRPEILRLKSRPQVDLAEASEATWLLPEPEKKLQVNSQAASVSSRPLDEFEAEFHKLAALKSRLAELKKEIHSQEKTIMSIWKSEFSACSSIQCYFRTAVAKVPLLAHLIADHFRHHCHTGLDFFHNATHTNCSDSHELLLTEPDATYSHDDDGGIDQTDQNDNVEAQTIPSAPVEAVEVVTPVAPVPPSQPESPDKLEPPFEHPHGPPFWAGGKSPWAHGGRPPWAKPGSRPPWGPPPWAKPGELPPWKQHDHPHSPFGPHSHHPQQLMPTLTPQQIWRIRLVGAMIGLLVVLFFAACVVTCIRHKARIFRDPRWRAEMLTRREEWKTKRLYRKAACKHRFRSFFRRLGTIVRATEEEEKQAMLAPQDDLVVNREISNLRAAHQFVGDLMRAEEGESRFTASGGPTLIRSESLPSYTSAPPGYASGLEGDISVIDGFTGYTPSNTGSTPESSIIDCSPRMSFETQRTS